MGWWRTGSGAVIGDAAADYIEQLAETGLTCVDPQDLPDVVREHLAGLYVEGIGRPPTEADLRDLLAFCG